MAEILWSNAVFIFGWKDPEYKEIPKDPETIPQRSRSFEGATFIQNNPMAGAEFVVKLILDSLTKHKNIHYIQRMLGWGTFVSTCLHLEVGIL